MTTSLCSRGEIATLEVMMTHKALSCETSQRTSEKNPANPNDLSTTCWTCLVEGCPLEWREDTALGGSCSKILGRLETSQIFTELMSPLRCSRRTSTNLGHCGRTASGIWESPEHCEDRTGGHSDSQHRSRHCAQNVWHLRQLGHLCRGALGWRGESGGRREAYDATASGRRPKCQMEHRLLRFFWMQRNALWIIFETRKEWKRYTDSDCEVCTTCFFCAVTVFWIAAELRLMLMRKPEPPRKSGKKWRIWRPDGTEKDEKEWKVTNGLWTVYERFIKIEHMLSVVLHIFLHLFTMSHQQDIMHINRLNFFFDKVVGSTAEYNQNSKFRWGSWQIVFPFPETGGSCERGLGRW